MSNTLTNAELLEWIDDLRKSIARTKMHHDAITALAEKLGQSAPQCHCNEDVEDAERTILAIQELYDLRQLHTPTTD